MLQESNKLSPVLSPSLPARVREAAAQIMAESRHIRIRGDKIAQYTQDILAKYPIITALDANHFLSEASAPQTAAYVLALDSVNFGSGCFYEAKKAGVALEYETIARGLKAAFLSGRLNTPEKWLAATPAECHDIFNIPAGAHPALDGLMSLFARHLQGSGEAVTRYYGGSVMDMVEEAGHSAVKLAATVAAWPTFADMPFYKRAQIFAADIHLALQRPFTDMDDLTCFADNMVPHVLRCDGILEYAPGLASAIDAGVLISPNSQEERELRAAAVHCVELMKQASGGRATSVNIDHILWNRGYEPAIYARQPHRTLTACY